MLRANDLKDAPFPRGQALDRVSTPKLTSWIIKTYYKPLLGRSGRIFLVFVTAASVFGLLLVCFENLNPRNESDVTPDPPML
jgi:hypothetical protein